MLAVYCETNFLVEFLPYSMFLPFQVGSLFAGGMTVFCGAAYYYAFTSDATPVPLMPYGGALLMAGWLAMVL